MPAEDVYVLDACAVVAFLQDEVGAKVVGNLLKDTKHRCLLHAINACEVYYDVSRRDGEGDAEALRELFRQSGITLVEDLSADLWQGAGKLKAEWRRVSLADCFALALTIREQGTLLTSDHHELDDVARAELCRIRFIR